MSVEVLYYSRTGNSKKVAELIGEELGVNPIRIVSDMSWKGFFGYMKAGYYSMSKKTVPIQLERQPSKDSEIILVAPLWAGDIAVEASTYVKENEGLSIHMVVLSQSSDLKHNNRFKSIHGIKQSKNYDAESIKILLSDMGIHKE